MTLHSSYLRYALLTFLLFAAICLSSANNIAYGAAAAVSGGAESNYQGQATPRTNVNEVTDFIPTELRDKGDLDTTFRDAQIGTKTGIESGSSAREMEQELNLEGNPQAKAAELGSISAHDLESSGISARHSDCGFYDENKMEVDYTEPLVAQHKNDVDHILKGCESFMTNILSGLKSLGIDCKTVVGNREQEPGYNVYTEQAPSQDTTYDQKFCEQPHHTYSCNYVLTTTCIRPSFRFSEWEDRMMNYWDVQYHWLRSIKWKKKRWGMHMRDDPGTMNEVRHGIAAKEKVESIEQIHPYVAISARGEGNITECRRHEVKWDYYVFGYKYRKAYPICLQWQDVWREQCKVD